MTKASATSSTSTATHHRRMRYNAAGKDWPKNRPTSDQAAVRVPAERDLARASSIDRCATSDASGAVERISDRWVATRW